MREALGLASKRITKSHGNRLDKHEYAELIKQSSTAEDLGAGHAEAAQVQGLGLSRVPCPWEESRLPASLNVESVEKMNASMPSARMRDDEEESEDEGSKKKRKREEKKREKHEKRSRRHSGVSDDKRKHNKEKQNRRCDSD